MSCVLPLKTYSHILLLLEDLHRIQSRFRDLEGTVARRIFTCGVPEFVVAFSNTSNPRIAQPSMQDLIPRTPNPHPSSETLHHQGYAFFFGPKILQIFLPNKKTNRFPFCDKTLSVLIQLENLTKQHLLPQIAAVKRKSGLESDKFDKPRHSYVGIMYLMLINASLGGGETEMR